MLARFYNERSMRRFGWDVSWLALPDNATPRMIINAVKAFQKQEGLTTDGKLGPTTFRRLDSWRKLQLVNAGHCGGLFLAEYHFGHKEPSDVGALVIDGGLVTVPFKAVPYSDKFRGLSLMGTKKFTKRNSPPTNIVWHWDAALSAKSCHKILSGTRRASSHGCIDNDGTFYQFVDFSTHYTWHAGIRKVNRSSVGIDFSNAVYRKYNKWYTAHGFGPRPVIEAETNGHKHSLLGYYPAQLMTAAHLAAFFETEYSIPLCWPTHNNQLTSPHLFKGHFGHYHCKTTKWDPAGLPWRDIMLNAMEINDKNE